MKTSEAGLQRIREREAPEGKPVLRAYRDSVGVWTIGLGTIRYPDGRRVTWTDSCFPAEAEAWFRLRVDEFERDVLEALPLVPLNQPMFDALVSLAYNIGGGAFRSSTLIRHLNAGEWIEAQAEFDKWVMAGGLKTAGLVNRRNDEQEDFNDGIRQALTADPVALEAFNRYVDDTNIG